jgi:hypothetical protein
MQYFIKNRKLTRRFQQGGPMEAPMEEQGGAPTEEQGGAPMEEQGGAPQQGGEDPMMQLAQMFAQGLQNQDCQMLAQGAQMFMQLIQQAQGGGGQPQEQQAEPVFRRGGRLAYRIY